MVWNGEKNTVGMVLEDYVSSNVSLTNSTSALTGLSIAIPNLGPGSTWLVHLHPEVRNQTASTTTLIELLLDGVAITAPIIRMITVPADIRATLGQTWVLTGMAAGTRTVTARATVTGTSITTTDTHCVVQCVA